MKKLVLVLGIAIFSTLIVAAGSAPLDSQVERLQYKTEQLIKEVNELQRALLAEKARNKATKASATSQSTTVPRVTTGHTASGFHDSNIVIHTPDGHPDSGGFYPTALLADNRVVTYIAGTPVVTSPYTGDRPAFDGSDYIVNISSINRDVRLMQQRRKLYRMYTSLGYPVPHVPIISISGKVEPFTFAHWPYVGKSTGDFNLGASELDVAAALNEYVEAFMSVAYDNSPLAIDGPRVDNSRFFLNMGFINIGNLDKTPFYFTAGQMFVPFGRFSSAMISSPLTMRLGRTKSRPFILGYKDQESSGFFAAVYGFKSEALLGRSGVGGVNLGYIFDTHKLIGEVGVSYNGSLTDSVGLQYVGPSPRRTFGGFSSVLNGSERITKIPGVDVHANMSFDSLNFTAEWVGATKAFRMQDLSYNTLGAKPQAGQLEAGMTFMAFNKPASIGVGYQWTREAVALGLPRESALAVFNISLWKDTVESLEYRHDIDYRTNQRGNGIAPVGLVNMPVIGTGRTSDTVTANIGVFF